MADLSWEEAIVRVLEHSEEALHYTEIAEQVASQGLRKKIGANPSRIVATILSKAMGDVDSPFRRVARGEYTLKDPGTVKPESDEKILDTSEEETESGALQAFGMYWRREFVSWAGKSNLLGRQGVGASTVNFADQVGVYLLHDRDRVIYVGRAQKDSLYVRLKAHTNDRLSGRWDRFSWFGIRGVESDGSLGEPSTAWNYTFVIDTLEALLIESLEPPLNRKRGDNFSGAEYLQVIDPTIEKSQKKQLISEMLKSAGLDDG